MPEEQETKVADMLDRRKFIGGALAGGVLAGGVAAGGVVVGAPIAVASSGAGAHAGDSASTAVRPDAIEPLVDHMLGTRHADIPAAALAMTRAMLFDTAGIALAARNEQGVRQLRDLGAEIGGKGESVVWGSALRLPCHDAARINAVMVHALEYDDTYGPGFLHSSAITFPAALAVADMVAGSAAPRRISGAEFLAASTVAIDIACRLSIAGSPGVDGFATGWHNTTLIGHVSSALLAARLMGLDRARTIHAVGIACHQAAGNAQSHIDGALTKRMGPGFATAAGIMAARLAARGVTGPRGVLEGRKGWFAQYHAGRVDRDLLLGGLGKNYPATATSFKPWPSCRGSHTSADAALQIAGQISSGQIAGADVRGIEQVTIRNGPAEWSFLSNPIARKRRPATPVEAQFSIPWVVAAALTDGKLKIAHFTPEALGRADILAMAARISTVEDAALANPKGGPGQAIVEVTLRDGQTLRSHVKAARGDPEAPMGADEAMKKFTDCLEHAGFADGRAATSRRDALLRVLGDVDGLDSITRLTAAMA